MFSKGFFYILPTLLVFTEGKGTESFITASALKVSVLVSVRHMIYLHAIMVNVRSITNGGFCLSKTENYCKLCNVWRDISALICHFPGEITKLLWQVPRISMLSGARKKKRRHRKKGKKNKSLFSFPSPSQNLRALPFIPG